MTAKIVEIRGKDGTGKDWSGKYPFLSATAQRITVQLPGGKTAAFPRGWAVGLPESFGVTLSYEELLSEIAKRFNVLDRLTDGLINGHVRALIVSGAAGVGKTFNIERKLLAAKLEGTITKYTAIRGTLSPIGLYMQLWKHRGEGEILLLDDTDAAFEQLDVVNLLKAGLDTGKTRWVSYIKEASALKDAGVPQRFEMKGRVCFVSNIDMDAAVNSGSKMAPHLSALMSRAIYCDLGLHSNQALLARVEDVCRSTPMLREIGLDETQVDEVIQWIKDNHANLRTLSLRTAMQLASLVKTDPDWKGVAKVTMLKAVRR